MRVSIWPHWRRLSPAETVGRGLAACGAIIPAAAAQLALQFQQAVDVCLGMQRIILLTGLRPEMPNATSGHWRSLQDQIRRIRYATQFSITFVSIVCLLAALTWKVLGSHTCDDSKILMVMNVWDVQQKYATARVGNSAKECKHVLMAWEPQIGVSPLLLFLVTDACRCKLVLSSLLTGLLAK